MTKQHIYEHALAMIKQHPWVGSDLTYATIAQLETELKCEHPKLSPHANEYWTRHWDVYPSMPGLTAVEAYCIREDLNDKLL
jgi:hypothetical protein